MQASSTPAELLKYADSVFLPAWIIDAATGLVKYCNRRSRALFPQILPSKHLKGYLSKEVAKKINDELFENGYYIGIIGLDVSSEEKKFQLSANNIKENYAIITLLEIRQDNDGIVSGRDYGYDDLFESANDLIQGTSLSGDIIYVNNSWIKTLGYTEIESTQLNIRNIIQPRDHRVYSDHRERVIKGEETGPILLHLRTKDGNEVIVETNDNLKLINGEANSVRSIMRDITSTVIARSEARSQAAKMQAMFNSGNLMFWTVNRNVALTYFNEQYAKTIFKLYGKRPVINKDLNKPREKFASESYHNFWNKKYESVFKTGKSIVFQTKTKDKEGQQYHREIYLNPIFSHGDNPVVIEVAGMGIDITEKKLAQEQVQEAAQKTQTIFNSADHMVWSLDKNWNFTSFNDVFIQKSFKSYRNKPEIGDNFLEFVTECCPNQMPKWKKAIRELEKNKPSHFEVEITDTNGIKEIEDITVSPITNNDNELKEIACISQTITYRRAAERKLKEQAAKISAIFNSSAMIIWSVDSDMRLVSFNEKFGREFFKWFNEEPSIGINMLKALKKRVKPDAFANYKKIVKSVFKGNPEQFEGVIYSKNGNRIWLESFYRPMFTTEKTVTEMSCMAHDITEKKNIEYQMRESIAEKEILLQEVHHRVKNNLQVISSILNLQSSYVKDEKSLSILRESQNRIKSMSFIHEALYQTRDFSKIEFSGYIRSLATNLIHTYNAQPMEIELKTDFQKAFLELDQAIPCGLIVNELISNSLKYAFEGMSKGEIYVEMRDTDSDFSLKIGDNGVGMPDHVDFRDTETLGLQLVNTLSEQLDATVSIDNKAGTEYLITFAKR